MTIISVVVPTFNRHNELHSAVSSVLQQRLEPQNRVEVIIVDDSSTPEISRQASLKHESVTIVRTPRNMGAAGARNLGIAASSGQIIAFLDSDDVWKEYKLTRQLALFRRLCGTIAPDQVAISCAYHYPLHFSRQLQARIPRPALQAIDFATGCWFCPGSTLLLHRSAFDRVGPFDESLRRLEDLDWFLRFGRAGGQLHVDPYVGASISPSNSYGSNTLTRATKIIQTKFLSANSPLPMDHQRLLRSYLALEHCACAFREGRRLSAIAHFLTSLRLKPRLTLALERQWKESKACRNAQPHG